MRFRKDLRCSRGGAGSGWRANCAGDGSCVGEPGPPALLPVNDQRASGRATAWAARLTHRPNGWGPFPHPPQGFQLREGCALQRAFVDAFEGVRLVFSQVPVTQWIMGTTLTPLGGVSGWTTK